MTKGGSLVLRIYFAVVSAVTLFTLMYGAIDFLTIGLKTYVFTAADVPTYIVDCPSVYPDGEPTKVDCERSNESAMENYRREKANTAVRNLALIIISLPLFLLHFRIVYRDWKTKD